MVKKVILTAIVLAAIHQTHGSTCHLKSRISHEFWDVSCKNGYEQKNLDSTEGQALARQIMKQMKPGNMVYYLCCKHDGHADIVLEETPAYTHQHQFNIPLGAFK